MHITNYITFIVPGCDYGRTKCNVQYVHVLLSMPISNTGRRGCPNRIRLAIPIDTLSRCTPPVTRIYLCRLYARKSIIYSILITVERTRLSSAGWFLAIKLIHWVNARPQGSKISLAHE